jgi:hypothetical protein
MEPVSTTAIYNLLTFLVGYYVGTDFYNYYKARTEFNEIQRRLDNIETSLHYLKNK